MKKTSACLVAVAVAAAAVAAAAPATAGAFTVAECLSIESGLNALNYAGAQLRDQNPAPAGARQYRLGAARWPVAMNLAALSRVSAAFAKSRAALILEVGGGKDVAPGTPEMGRLTDELQKILDKPCDVAPARMKLGDLLLGDGADQNQIPPAVLGALAPIIDP